MAAICSSLKSLPVGKKNFGFIALEEEILKQPSIDCIMWVVVVTILKIYNERGQAEQANNKMKILKRKRTTRSRIELRSVFKELYGLRNRINETVLSGHGPNQVSNL